METETKSIEEKNPVPTEEELKKLETALKLYGIKLTKSMFHQPTAQHFFNKKRGVGITRKVNSNTKKTKKTLKMEKNSRKINRKRR